MTSSDWKPVASENPDYKCRHCSSGNVWYRIVESFDGAYEDINYSCKDCSKQWWYESADY